MPKTDAEILAKIREEDHAFKLWFDTLPEEHQGKADHLYQEGRKLQDIQAAIAMRCDTTEHPVQLTRWEIGTLAYLLYHQTAKNEKDRALYAKLIAAERAVDEAASPSSLPQ